MMKATLPILLTALVLALPGAAFSQQSGRNPAIRDSATHDQLSQTLRMAQQNDPVRNSGPAMGKTEEDPSVKTTTQDLIASSAIFSYRGQLTLVPKRAVLHIPDALKERTGVTEGAKIQTWQDFYQANRGWIRTIEVTREQALGHVPFSEAIIESISKSSSVVIATFKTGPISVLPLKDPEDVPTPAETKSILYAR